MATTFLNANVLGGDTLQICDFSFGDGVISHVMGDRTFDLSGFMILPGIVDIHGDGFEHHLAKRRGMLKDIQTGLRAAHAELASNGITTAVMAQFFSWEGGMRGPEFAAVLLPALREFQQTVPTELVAQLRMEIHMTDQYDEFLGLVRDYSVPYVVFNDHLPHEALRKGKKPPRLNGQALKAKRSPDQHLAMLQKLHDQHAQVMANLPAFASQLLDLGCRLGSHDDHMPEQRATYAAMGADICEFPETHAAAVAAQGPVLMGAPNFVRGGSHKDNVSAVDLVAEDLVTALASDYHYPSLWAAMEQIAETRGWGYASALVSAGPANVLGLDDRGLLQIGKRADFIVVHQDKMQIQGTFAAGKPTFVTGDLAERLMRQ
jgi:alpha-D-ribose 1-methylphosphonate 5-triphosphate diphosphatase